MPSISPTKAATILGLVGATFLISYLISLQVKEKMSCPSNMDELICQTCRSSLILVESVSKEIAKDKHLVEHLDKSAQIIAGALCKIFKAFTPRVCSGYVRERLTEIVYIFSNTNHSMEYICANYFSMCYYHEYYVTVRNPRTLWTIELPPPLPQKITRLEDTELFGRNRRSKRDTILSLKELEEMRRNGIEITAENWDESIRKWKKLKAQKRANQRKFKEQNLTARLRSYRHRPLRKLELLTKQIKLSRQSKQLTTTDSMQIINSKSSPKHNDSNNKGSSSRQNKDIVRPNYSQKLLNLYNFHKANTNRYLNNSNVARKSTTSDIFTTLYTVHSNSMLTSRPSGQSYPNKVNFSSLVIHTKPILATRTMKKLKILHLADLHFDMLYREGAIADCPEPICCQIDSPKPHNNPNPRRAGKWGDVQKCDLPYHTVVDLFQKLSQQQFDLIYWTGDLYPHDDWRRNHAKFIEYSEKLIALFKKYFPLTPVYHAIGNHDVKPLNSFPHPYLNGHPKFSLRWLWERIVNDIASTGTSKQDLQNFTHGAFYSTLVKPGFRLISLNSNYCYLMNFWLMLNPEDPADELRWLVNELTKAEQKQEKVHIIGHIPPGGDQCLIGWSWNYNQVIARFRNTVTGQFFGHDHRDLIQLNYDDTYEEPVGVGYVAPSLTTYADLNPAYRVYEVDEDTKEIIDSLTYYLDLETANQQNGEPQWQFLYSAKTAYNMTDLSPVSWEKVIRELENQPTLLMKFASFMKRHAKSGKKCEIECLLKNLCKWVSGRTSDLRVCKRLSLNYFDPLLDELIPETFCTR